MKPTFVKRILAMMMMVMLMTGDLVPSFADTVSDGNMVEVDVPTEEPEVNPEESGDSVNTNDSTETEETQGENLQDENVFEEEIPEEEAPVEEVSEEESEVEIVEEETPAADAPVETVSEGDATVSDGDAEVTGEVAEDTIVALESVTVDGVTITVSGPVYKGCSLLLLKACTSPLLSRVCTTGPGPTKSPTIFITSFKDPPPLKRKSITIPSTWSALSFTISAATSAAQCEPLALPKSS